MAVEEMAELMPRIIAHFDMDAFYAAIEERDTPAFRGLPLVVGADPVGGQGRGVVSTANYKAREYGIFSATPISTAWRFSEAARRRGLPPVTFVSVDMGKYARVSAAVMAILRRVLPVLEQASIDEAYGDVSGAGSFEAAAELCRSIKHAILTEERLTASVGIGPNKMIAKIASGGRPTAAELAFEGRKGGHTFVMDDGDVTGNNNFFRLKSSAGHQILMHDSSDFIYISNSKGTAWIELNSAGDIEIYSGGSFSLRSEFDINLHADQNINMYAGKNINILAEDKIATESTTQTINSKKNTTIDACGDLELKSGTKSIWDAGTTLGLKSSSTMNLQGSIINLNTADPGKVNPVKDIARNSFSNAVQTANRYKSVSKRISTITTRAPTHEPDVGHLAKINIAKVLADPGEVDNNAGRVPANALTVKGNSLQDSTGNTTTFGPKLATDVAQAKTPTAIKGMENLAIYLGKQPKPAKKVGTLTADETRALYAGIAKSESGHNYNAVNNIGYLGKYQMGSAALVEQGYIKPEYYKKYGPNNSFMSNPDAWTGKDGVNSKEAFLAAPAAQETAMEGLTATNYNRMVKTGAIQPGDDPATVAGMLQTAHLLGAGGATAWRNGKGGQDANGVTGDTYFAKGKYAIATLTKDGTSVA